jgi:outer membrane protein assembly factor BamB
MITCGMLALLGLAGAAAGAPPVVTAVSDSSVARSGRFMITGSNFGDASSSRVEIGGTPAPTTRWGGSSITAYVRGDIAPGPTTLRVITAEGSSNAFPFTVEPLPPAQGRVAWAFQADSPYFLHRAAVGADGTVYAQDVRGFLYAISADGGLRWIYNAGGYPSGGGGEGPVAITSEGTIVVVGDPLGPDVNIIGVHPDGSHGWTFTVTGTQGVIAGPSIGPDGNIYVVTDNAGAGMTSLTPAGQFRWSNPGNPTITENGQVGAELVFGPHTAGGAPDQVYCAFDERGIASDTLFAFGLDGGSRFAAGLPGEATGGQRQPVVGIDGSIYLQGTAYSPADGSALWSLPTPTGDPADVGADGIIYIRGNLGQIRAFNPSGSARWVHTETGMFDGPIAGPAGAPVIFGGRIDFGQPGFVKAIDAGTGALLWTVPLPSEAGLNQIPSTRARFGPAGRRAYIGTEFLGQASGQEYSYLLALDVLPPCSADFNCDGDVGTDADIEAFFACIAGSCPTPPCLSTADFNHDGDVGTDADIESFFRVLAGGPC